MTNQGDAVQCLYDAQMRNGDLATADLVEAADVAARQAQAHGALLWAGDLTGERIIGAALARHPGSCAGANRTGRVDAKKILVVSGAVAGPLGLIGAAASARSMGAVEVHAVVLGGWSEPVPGCDSVHGMGVNPSGHGWASPDRRHVRLVG